jgi:adenylate kinase family enzyme
VADESGRTAASPSEPWHDRGMSRARIDDLQHARKVLIHGVTGSGKSTAAERIGRILDLPVHLVDEEIGWLPASQAPWTNRSPQKQQELAETLSAQPRWVFDSTYGTFRDIVMPRADVVVGLDYSRALTLGRLLRRTAGRIRDGQEICNGNRETLRQALGRDSIIAWHFQSFTRKHETLSAWEQDPDGPAVLRLRTPAELEQVLACLT